MKVKTILLTLVLLVVLFVGCAKKATPPVTPPEATPNVVTTASIVNTAANFEKAISNKGTWIIAITKDLVIDEELVVEGEYKNGKKDTAGKDLIQRKVALYAQDEARKVTATYMLTAPKMTFNSPMGSIEHGTFKGDLYISASNFQLKDAVVDGNVYFTTAEAKSTFKMDAKSKVTGKQEMKK